MSLFRAPLRDCGHRADDYVTLPGRTVCIDCAPAVDTVRVVPVRDLLDLIDARRPT